jgi:hypothetical protein
MVGLMNKDFYIDSHYICGVRSPENIFDLPDTIFECFDFMCFEEAIKNYVIPLSVKLYRWPWMWETSNLTDEVYIYDMISDRIIYYTSDMKEFFDAKLVRKEQCLQGCEIFDYNLQFPKMISLPPIHMTEEKKKP